MKVPGGLSDSRVAVVTTSLDEGENALWEAIRPNVGALTVIGARQPAPAQRRPGTVPLPEVDLFGKGLVWRHLVGLRRALRASRPDLVHVNAELWTVTAQELCALPTRVVIHGAENIWDHGYRLERILRSRLVERSVDRIAGYASWNHEGVEHVRRLHAERDGSPFPTLVLPAIVPPSEFRRESWPPPSLMEETPLEVLLVGRLIPAKGFHIALDAAARITSRPVRVTVCGKGSATAALVARARQDGVGLVHHRWLESRQLAALMARSHVLIQPSLTTSSWAEQFGRTVAEAMTVGLPALVSDSGELPHLVGHDPTAIFKEGDVDQLAGMLQRIGEDPSYLTELSRRQTGLAVRYDPSTAADRLGAFWAEVLS